MDRRAENASRGISKYVEHRLNGSSERVRIPGCCGFREAGKQRSVPIDVFVREERVEVLDRNPESAERGDTLDTRGVRRSLRGKHQAPETEHEREPASLFQFGFNAS